MSEINEQKVWTPLESIAYSQSAVNNRCAHLPFGGDSQTSQEESQGLIPSGSDPLRGLISEASLINPFGIGSSERINLRTEAFNKLHFAIKNQDCDRIRKILQDNFFSPHELESSVLWAIDFKNLDMFELLVEFGASPDCLDQALIYEASDIAEVMIIKYGVSVTECFENCSPLEILESMYDPSPDTLRMKALISTLVEFGEPVYSEPSHYYRCVCGKVVELSDPCCNDIGSSEWRW